MARSLYADTLEPASSKAIASTGIIAAMVATVIFVVIVINRLTSKPKPYQLFPVWATLEIGLTSYLLSQNGLGRRVLLMLRRNSGSLVGLSSKHQILLESPHTNRLMSQSRTILDPFPVQYTLLTRVFGAVDSIPFQKKMEASYLDLKTPVERLFLNEAAATAALERAKVAEQANSFVTFNTNPSHMKPWEHSAKIRLIQSEGVEKVEANLQSLVRDFGACIAIPQLYGQDFLDRYPQVLEDLWKFDNELFPFLMIGLPLWAPFKGFKEGLAARTRIITELEALYRRIDQYQQGDPVDFHADMRDISETALGRNSVYRRDGWSFPERGTSDLGLLWGQNANTQPLLFWLLTYVYSTSGLLDKVREEVSPYVMSTSTLDIQGLSRNCPLLKACVYETYRLVNEPTSIRSCAVSVHIPNGGLKHGLKPGTFMSVPYSLVNRDASIYSNPEKFDPGRFLELDPSSGTHTARYGRMKPWGSGPGICKGRIFAEKELLALGARLLSVWDIAPMNGTWKLPGMVPGTGVRKPTKDIRVVITRRA